ncbi:LuxR family transcriptional regulator [Haloactinopolyspora alba]|uniref:LuxR family transcriptional regulator n=1 Tax=Haloactinopolyspora alba TaxID=648780 RepID=A0A2P8EFS1_9ACTN|nr:LuxR family transcriptional regulator [Haloactinopolyspora alba]PSL08309.1 LuxR family transcriptional regulator [Haloactinopolyspora alba]
MTTVDARARARVAFEHQAWGEAYEQLTAADRHTALGPDDLERLALAAHLTGRMEKAADGWERAHQVFVAHGETARAVRCAFWLGMTLFLRGHHARGGGWMARGRRLLEEMPADSVERGYLMVPTALQALGSGDPAAASTLFAAVSDIADRFGDPDLVALGRLGRGQSLVTMGQASEGVALLDDAMLTVTTGDVSPLAAGIVYCAVIIACRDIFDLRRAQEWTAALSRWCAEQPDLKPYRGQCLVHRSEIMQLRGEWSDAMAEVQEACAHLADPPGDPVMGSAMYQQGELLRLRGEFTKAEAAYREAGNWGHAAQPGLALLRLAQGRGSDAEAAIRRVIDEATGPVERARVLSAYVEIMLAGGHVEAGRSAADELAATAEAFATPYLRAVAGYAQGAVLLTEGDATAAGSVLRESWTSWCELGAPYEAARARALIGVVCLRMGDTDSASVECDGARRVFEELSAVPDLARLEALFRPAATGSSLTSREVEVLGLVATGMTNQQIAAELVISEHTVRRHVQNIFGRLGLSSRAAATAYAYRHGLL